MVEVDHVDRVDGRAGVGVGGEQHPARRRVQVHRPLQELDPVHPRHPVVGHDHGHLVAAQLHLAQRVERGVAGLGAHDPVLLAVPSPQVTGHRPGHAGVVVHRHDRGSRRAFRRRHSHHLTGPGHHIPPC